VGKLNEEIKKIQTRNDSLNTDLKELYKQKKVLNTDMAVALKKLNEDQFKKCRKFFENHTNAKASYILEALVAVLRSNAKEFRSTPKSVELYLRSQEGFQIAFKRTQLEEYSLENAQAHLRHVGEEEFVKEIDTNPTLEIFIPFL